MPSKLNHLLCGVVLLAMSNSVSGAQRANSIAFQQKIKPLLQTYCVRCHGEVTSEAEIRIDEINPDIVNGEHFGRWEDIREVFNSGEMPPQGEPQPVAEERELITGWLETEFKKAKQQDLPRRQGSVRRMTRYELRYSLEDLLNVSVEKAVSALPEEGTSSETGLKNSSGLLMVSSPHLESYLNLIVSVVDQIKEIAAHTPYSASVDIANLDTDPPKTFAAEGRPNKPVVSKIERAGKRVIVNPGGYVDLQIPSISKCKFQTSITARSTGAARIRFLIGFKHSEVDPRERIQELGTVQVRKTDGFRSYTLDCMPETLPAEMTRALDRPFFVRLVNQSKQKLYLEAFEFKGNDNRELMASLLPAKINETERDDHFRLILAKFIERAFRRPPSDAVLSKYYKVYQEHARQQNQIVALLNTYKEILCSPRFFYLGLQGERSTELQNNYQLAERLAFFLWCSIPDEQLLSAASAAELTRPQVLASQVARMLSDEKSQRWVRHFTDQWLQTSKLYNVAVDRNYYPKFKDSLKELMHRETLESVNDVFRNGASALELLKADHVFVNETLAAFYQLKGVKGDEFRKVAVREDDNRGGLLTQGTFLVGNSDGINSHAILRGVWLAEVILNDPPPEPPKNVPALDENIPGFEKMTLNQRLFAHRNNTACKSCHNKIDPLGIPFENYDASGAWREKVLVVSKVPGKRRNRKKPTFEKSYVQIDRESTLPDQTKVDGVNEFRDYLVNHRTSEFAKGLTLRILAYALSRDIDGRDEAVVNHLSRHLEDNNYSVPMLICEIVNTEQFRRGY